MTRHMAYGLPASTGSFSALEHSNEVERLFLSKGINSNGSRRPCPDDGNSPHWSRSHGVQILDFSLEITTSIYLDSFATRE